MRSQAKPHLVIAAAILIGAAMFLSRPSRAEVEAMLRHKATDAAWWRQYQDAAKPYLSMSTLDAARGQLSPDRFVAQCAFHDYWLWCTIDLPTTLPAGIGYTGYLGHWHSRNGAPPLD